MDKLKNWLSVGQFSKRVGASPRALRLYEKLGLLCSDRRGENGYRYYRESQIEQARRILSLKALGFSLQEIRLLLDANTQVLHGFLKQRIGLILKQEVDLREQRVRVQDLLASSNFADQKSIRTNRSPFMKILENPVIVVTGTECLESTALQISKYLEILYPSVQIIAADQLREPISCTQPLVVLLPEAQLFNCNIEQLKPDVVVIRNVSQTSKAVMDSYLKLYSNVVPNMATVLNADDGASLELARNPIAQKGKIFYYSKNTGLRDQIQKIGGTVSDGEDVEVFGFNPDRRVGTLIRMERPRPLAEEITILAALTAVLDLGLSPDQIAKVV